MHGGGGVVVAEQTDGLKHQRLSGWCCVERLTTAMALVAVS